MSSTPRPIRVGIGGWDYEPWRGTFYPPDLPKTQQLSFAATRMTAIEINATYYKLQRPELFERWAGAVPEDFVFTLKGSRFCTNRKQLGEGGEAVARFCGQGFTRLGRKLGPILWQLMATKRFDAEEIAAFFAMLPRELDGVELRHVIEARHESFRDERFAAIAREAQVAICIGDEEAAIGSPDGDLVYARLTGAREEEPAGYAPAELDHWAQRAAGWSVGPQGPRSVFVFLINGAKVRAPAAAQALIAQIDRR